MFYTPPFQRVARHSFRIAAALLVTARLFAAQTTPPRIDRIELLFTDLVTVHFDTAPNRKYELQFIDELPGGNNSLVTPPPNAAWSNLFVAPAVPFPNHYVIADTRTNRHRFYRLRVTP